MKTISPQLQSYLDSTDVESTFLCDLITITLQSGLTIYCTDGMLPITYLGNVYEPVRWGSWRCEGTTCELGVMNATAKISLVADASVLMPNWDCPILEAIQLGLFDAAAISILSNYGSTYGETDLGPVVRFAGVITELKPTGRTMAEGECKPDTFTLNQQMPRKLLQPGCGWVLGDIGCTINLALYTATASVGASSNKSVITPTTAFTQPDGYFTQGIITMTSGRNTGLAGFVQLHVGGALQLNKPFLFPVATGDTFTVSAGCDHSMSVCLGKFANLQNYGGTPFVPDYNSAV
jgi:uncharacterized phage protein (TIGR02218 family)